MSAMSRKTEEYDRWKKRNGEDVVVERAKEAIGANRVELARTGAVVTK